MRDCYVAEINRLGEDTSARDQQHVDDRLTGYLIILYIKAAFPDDVLELFWDTAPVRARQHAMWFLGVQLELPLDKFPDDLRARALSYWDRRLAATKASSPPDYFREKSGDDWPVLLSEGHRRRMVDGSGALDVQSRICAVRAL